MPSFVVYYSHRCSHLWHLHNWRLPVPAENPLPGKIVSVMWRAGSAEGANLRVSTDKRIQ